jgi:hypothetical protein
MVPEPVASASLRLATGSKNLDDGTASKDCVPYAMQIELVIHPFPMSLVTASNPGASRSSKADL